MKSKITNIEQVGEFSNTHGQFYTYEYTFENGESGQAVHKTQGVETLKNKVGEEKEFEIETTDYRSKIKWIQSNDYQAKSYGRSPEEQLIIARQSSLKIAVDYFSMNGFLDEEKYGTKTAQMIDVADIFTNYAINGK